VPVTSMNQRALKDSGLTTQQIDRSRNFFALGLMFWLYERPMESTLRWIEEKFAKNPDVAGANADSLKAGYNFGETAELFPVHYRVPPAHLPPGRYQIHVGAYEATGGTTGTEPLKLYSIYSPANHPKGTVHRTKADAEKAEASH